MEILKNLLDIIFQYKVVPVLGIIAPFALGLWTIVFQLWAKNKELKHQRFLAYHKLIKNLVQPEKKNLVQPKESESGMFVDRQIAAIFELRNFKEYHEVTIRMLEGMKETWKEHVRLLDEIDHTIKYCEAGWKARICRKIGLWRC